MLPGEAEEALAELVALGVVNSDSFGGLRALLVPSRPVLPATVAAMLRLEMVLPRPLKAPVAERLVIGEAV